VDVECIVVDDGSTDGTSDWLAALRDPRVRIVHTTGGRGPSGARNDGIRAATARYIAFQDSDDEWLPGKLERQIAAFDREPRPVLCFTGVTIDAEGRRRNEVADIGGPRPFDRLLNYAGPITTPGLVIDREMAGDQLHFDESMPAMEERELVLRLARDHPVARVSEPLYVWYHRDGPRVTEPGRQIIGRRRILEVFADELAARPTIEAYHHWRLAAAYRRVGDFTSTADELRTAARLDPKVRFRLLAAASRGPRLLSFAWRGLEVVDAARCRLQGRPHERSR